MLVALSRLQERLAALVASLPESAGFVLAGGAALAAHGALERMTRDLDYFAGPENAATVRRLADALERAAPGQGLMIEREREYEAFVRFRVRTDGEECEVDLGIDPGLGSLRSG